MFNPRHDGVLTSEGTKGLNRHWRVIGEAISQIRSRIFDGFQRGVKQSVSLHYAPLAQKALPHHHLPLFTMRLFVIDYEAHNIVSMKCRAEMVKVAKRSVSDVADFTVEAPRRGVSTPIRETGYPT